MTILVCLGETPDTWWQAKNSTGGPLLDRAAELSADEETRDAILVGRYAHALILNEMVAPLKERVWDAVEAAAAEIAAEAPPEGAERTPWAEHVAELAREMKARRTDPGRPGAWP